MRLVELLGFLDRFRAISLLLGVAIERIAIRKLPYDSGAGCDCPAGRGRRFLQRKRDGHRRRRNPDCGTSLGVNAPFGSVAATSAGLQVSSTITIRPEQLRRPSGFKLLCRARKPGGYAVVFVEPRSARTCGRNARDKRPDRGLQPCYRAGNDLAYRPVSMLSTIVNVARNDVD
jgi:hypothetical protein